MQPEPELDAQAFSALGRTAEPPPARVGTISELVRRFPHMATDSKHPDNSLDEALMEASRENTNPPITDIMRQRLADLPRPRLVMEQDMRTDSADIQHLLRQRRVMLPVLTASFESMLLAEAGSHTIPMETGPARELTFPECARGAQCIGNTHRLHGFPEKKPGVVLTALMFPEEYQMFLETGTAPLERRPCILCCRAHLTHFILSLRPNFQRLNGVDTGFTCQLYRNLQDDPDGYFSQFMLRPVATRYEGFMDCIVGYHHSQLRAFRDPEQGGRWVIDQSGMVYEEPPAPHVQPGETFRDFQQRVRASNGLAWDLNTALILKNRRFHDPFAALTREFGPSSPPVLTLPLEFLQPRQRTAAIAELRRIYDCPREPPRRRFLAGMLIDQSLLYRLPPGITLTQTQRETLKYLWCSPLFMADDIRQAAKQCCFWFQTPTNGARGLPHMMSKATPQPCQTRKFMEMCKRFVRRHEKNTQMIREVVMMALTGQFPGTPVENQLLPRWRDRIRLWCVRDPALLDRTFMSSQWLVTFALRRALVWAINDDPVFAGHVHLLCQWDAFGEEVENTLVKARMALNESTEDDWPVAGLRLWSGNMLRRVSEICAAAKDEVRSKGHQRQRPPLLSFLHTCQRDTHSHHTKKQREARMAAGKTTSQSGGRTRRELMRVQTGEVKDLSRGIRVDVMEYLYQLVRCFDPVDTDVERDIMPHLSDLGIPENAMARMKSMVRDFDVFRMGKRSLRTKMEEFNEQYPYSFRLFQIMCLLWQEHSHQVSYTLPAHYLHCQVTAIRHRASVPDGDDFLPVERCMLYFCVVCRQIYSVLRDTPRGKGKGRGKRKEGKGHQRGGNVSVTQTISLSTLARPPQRDRDVFGYEEVIVDHATDQLFCKWDTRRGHLRCSSQPLREIPLLGRCLLWGKKLLMICPSEHCGLAMAYDPEHCEYTRHGFVCIMCSRAIREDRVRRRVPLLAHPPKQCTMCSSKFRGPERAFLYPHDVVLCNKEHSQDVANYVKRARPMTHQETIDCIVYFRTEEHTRRAHLFRNRNRARLSQLRRNTRTRHRQVYV